MKKLIAIALLAASTASFAGKHDESTDSFTGRVSKLFTTTEAEFAQHRTLITISYVGNRLFLYVAPNGVTNCRTNNLMIKSVDGTIHRLNDTREFDSRACGAFVRPEWVKDRFEVRVPMWRNSPVDAWMDTSTLDLERLK
jgi:hypothetical protein